MNLENLHQQKPEHAHLFKVDALDWMRKMIGIFVGELGKRDGHRRRESVKFHEESWYSMTRPTPGVGSDMVECRYRVLRGILDLLMGKSYTWVLCYVSFEEMCWIG